MEKGDILKLGNLIDEYNQLDRQRRDLKYAISEIYSIEVARVILEKRLKEIEEKMKELKQAEIRIHSLGTPGSQDNPDSQDSLNSQDNPRQLKLNLLI